MEAMSDMKWLQAEDMQMYVEKAMQFSIQNSKK